MVFVEERLLCMLCSSQLFLVIFHKLLKNSKNGPMGTRVRLRKAPFVVFKNREINFFFKKKGKGKVDL